MFLQGNRSDQLEVSYYAISSHLNNQNSRKPVVRAFFTHIDAVITRNNEVSRPKYFFNHHHLLDIMPVYHHMQNQQKLMTQSPENGQKPHFEPNFDHFWPFQAQIIFFSKIGLRHFKSFIEGQLDAKNQKNLMVGSMRTFSD